MPSIEAFSDHWDFVAPDFDHWVEKTRTPSFDPQWWFIARTEQGEIAGFALGRMREDTLFINHIGVLRPCRGQGLGLALLQHAMSASFQAGQSTLSLGVDAANPSNAYRLYEKAGMKPIYEVTIYEKPIG